MIREKPLAAIRELTEAWIRKDAGAMAFRLSEDIVEIGPAFAQPLVGQKDFFRKYKAYLTSPLEILTFRIHRPRTEWLSNREALVYFYYRMKTRLKGIVQESRGKESMLVRHDRRGWRIRYIHWHQDNCG